MVWKDKTEQCLLTGLRLYFLPENTPIGRNTHGEVSSYKHTFLLYIIFFWYERAIRVNGVRLARDEHDEYVFFTVPFVAFISAYNIALMLLRIRNGFASYIV